MRLFFKLTLFIFLFFELQCKRKDVKTKSPYVNKSEKFRYFPNEARKLQGNDDGDDVEEEHYFDKLNIYLDTFNFNDSFPYDKEKYLDIFINAMKKAKNILENFIQIEIDSEAKNVN